MKLRIMMLVFAVMIAAFTLTGCKINGSGGGGSSYSGAAGGSVAGDATGGADGGGAIPHNPEPATMALVGLGAAAFAIHNRRKNKK